MALESGLHTGASTPTGDALANHKAGKARLNSCPRCHSPRLPHRVCPTCGTYAGREVVSHAAPQRAPGTPPDTEE